MHTLIYDPVFSWYALSLDEPMTLARRPKFLYPMTSATLLETLQLAGKCFYPNVDEILKLLLTVPVGSVSSGGSFTKMRRLVDWARAAMSEGRLIGLTLVYVQSYQ